MPLVLTEIVGWADNVMQLISDIGAIVAAGKAKDSLAVDAAIDVMIDHLQDFKTEIVGDIQD